MARKPDQWIPVLERKLAPQQKEAAKHSRYYDGDHPLGFASDKFQEAFGPLFEAFAVNWCAIVTDAPTERLAVEGFRFGDDKESDDEAWDIWQANYLDADSSLLHSEAIKCGSAYLLVDHTTIEQDAGYPRITVEHPSQVVVINSGGDRRKRLVAMKRWAEGDGTLRANVYLPEATYKFIADQPEDADGSGVISEILGESQLKWRAHGAVENPLGVVPVVPMRNNPTMLTGGKSELAEAEPIQDAINKETADMLVSSEFQAFRQRVLIGAQIPKDPETNQPMAGAELKALQSRLWIFENENAKIAEFGESPLSNYVEAIRSLRDDLAGITRTPPHYIAGNIVNASGDALKAAEAGLVAKVMRKQVDFAEGWEEAMRLAFRAQGDEKRGGATRAHTIWRDPENRTRSETVDAAIKLKSIDVPREALWKLAGFSEQEISLMKTLVPVTPAGEDPEGTTSDPNGDGIAGTTP